MNATFTPSDAINLIALVVGVILLMKKVAEVDGYHNLRRFILTSILSCVVIYFFLAYGCTLGERYVCDISFSESGDVY